MTSPFRHRTGQKTGWKEPDSALPSSVCLKLQAWVVPGVLEVAELLGCENPSTSTRTPSTLTLAGEHLEDDESSFEVAVFKGPAEPLGALLEGAAEPLDAILWVLMEPLEAVLGDGLNLYPSPKNTSRTRTEPGRRLILSSTSRRKPECRSIPIRVRQKNAH